MHPYFQFHSSSLNMDAAGHQPLTMTEYQLDEAPQGTSDLFLEAVMIVEEMHVVGREPRTANRGAVIEELYEDLSQRFVLIRERVPRFELFQAAA
ncbi:unnamed protein product [Caenorhabditis nigoni]